MTSNPDFSGKSLNLRFVAAGGLFLIIVLLYSPSLNNGFVGWDDSAFVTQNTMIRSLDMDHLRHMAASFHTGNWQPVTWISHALDYRLFGDRPGGHHLTSLVLHGFNTIMVFLLFYRLLIIDEKQGCNPGSAVWAAGAGALIFAIHPLRVESVAWISQRKDLLCALFVLCSLRAYLAYASCTHAGWRKRYYFMVWVFFLLALASKPMAVTLPVVFLLIDTVPLKRPESTGETWSSLLREKLPFIAVSLIIGIITLLAQKQAGAVMPLVNHSFIDRLANSVESLGFYAGKTVWPFNLVALYPFTRTIEGWSGSLVVSVLFVIGVTWFCIRQWIKGQRYWMVIWLYYLVTVAPVLGIVQVGRQAAADRYTYLPTLGFYLLMGMGVAGVWQRMIGKHSFHQWGISLLGAGCFVVLALLTHQQIQVWNNTESLWRHTATVYPGRVASAHYNLGNVYLNQGNLGRARREFQQAVEISPKYVKAYNGLGLTALYEGKRREAESWFLQGLEINPEDSPTLNHLGLMSYLKNHWSESESLYRRAIGIDPKNEKAHVNLGLLYFRQERLSESEFHFLRALELNPDQTDARNNLGILYHRLNRLEEAEAQYVMGLQTKFDSAELHFNLGRLFKHKEQFPEALVEFRHAARFRPGSALIHIALGETYAELGQAREAESEFESALRIDPANQQARTNLDRLRVRKK